MSVVDIRVDLPSYSRSFIISVSSVASVRQVKQEIYKTCPGQPRPEGQRLIWCGRLLSDDESVERLWKSDPKIVHLAVHPSAWSSSPPDVSQSKLSLPTPTSSVPYSPSCEINDNSLMAEHLRGKGRSNLTYVIYQHQLALSSLSSDIPLPTALENPEHCHLVAKDTLNCNGWIWPAILDSQFPSPSVGGLSYGFTMIDGHPYLRLLNSSEKLTARQEHALKVLTYTFSIVTLSPSPSAVRNALPQPISIPPHVNQLLQQMGLPPLRLANNHVQAIANQNNPALPEIREIPIRPLIAPLMMLFLRTVLLLYFVAPARKPIFSILIFLWMLYEIWQPIRIALRNRLGPIGQDQQEGNNGVGAGGAGQVGNDNVPPADPGQNAGFQPNMPVRPNVMAGALDQQFESIMDNLANMNVANEERSLNSTSAVPPSEPGIGHKAFTFIGLLLSTIHPAIWNRRRAALRRREGTIRTEANARNAPVEPEDDDRGSNSSNENRAAHIREELRTRFERQPLWIQRYVQRVINEDWVDDSD